MDQKLLTIYQNYQLTRLNSELCVDVIKRISRHLGKQVQDHDLIQLL